MRTVVILAAATMLAACGGNKDAAADGKGGTAAAASTAPVKRQPGSWGQTIQIVRLEGAGVNDQAKQGMQQIFDGLSKMTVCVTPEAAAQEDFSKNMEKLGAQGGECSVERKSVVGQKLDFAATCKKNGETMKVAMTGTSGATAQDMTITVQPVGNPAITTMEMRVAAKRNGECTSSDIRMPAAGATPAA